MLRLFVLLLRFRHIFMLRNQRAPVNPIAGKKSQRMLDPQGDTRLLGHVLHQVLKSKLHRAMITAADVEYEGSIEIPTDLMEAVGLWEGEKVLVASISTGNRLETYVQPGPAGTGNIIINGGAAHRIKKGERVAIMAFGLSETPVLARKVVLNDQNQIIRPGR